MVLKTKERPLAEKVEFKANSTKRVDIDQDNVIRRLALLFNIVLDTPAAMAAGVTPKEDGVLGAIKKIRLVMDADDNKFEIDAFKWKVIETIEKGTTPQEDAVNIPAAGSLATMQVLLNADFAQRRQDLSDISALLDAPNKSSLKLEIDWGSIADILVTPNDTVISDTTTVDVALVEVFDSGGDEATEALLAQNFLNIREGIDAFDVTKSNQSFDNAIQEEEVDPVPTNILTHLFVTKEDITEVSAPSIRVNDVITELKVENVRGQGEKIFQERYDILRFSNKTEYGLESGSVFTGAAYIDWIDQRRGGLANVIKDALKFRFLTNAPLATETDSIELFTRYITSRKK